MTLKGTELERLIDLILAADGSPGPIYKASAPSSSPQGSDANLSRHNSVISLALPPSESERNLEWMTSPLSYAIFDEQLTMVVAASQFAVLSFRRKLWWQSYEGDFITPNCSEFVPMHILKRYEYDHYFSAYWTA